MSEAEKKEFRKNLKKIEGLKVPFMQAMAGKGDDGKKIMNLLIDRYPIETQMLPNLKTLTMLKATNRWTDYSGFSSLLIYPEVILNFVMIWDVSEDIFYFVELGIHGRSYSLGEKYQDSSPMDPYINPTFIADDVAMMIIRRTNGDTYAIKIDGTRSVKWSFLTDLREINPESLLDEMTVRGMIDNGDGEGLHICSLAKAHWQRLSANRTTTDQILQKWRRLNTCKDKWSECTFDFTTGYRENGKEHELSGQWAIALSPTGVLYVYNKQR
ncbi:MAG: hypothetical protein Q7T54_03610 [Candidatus Levybacteria bacterium]|nr:hypothetical protein [Candidatus Levybacteria bacterium]